MQNILAIWQREMKSYFVSPIAYVVLTVFLFLSGLFFYGNLYEVVQYTMMQAQMGQGMGPIDVPSIVTQSLFRTTSAGTRYDPAAAADAWARMLAWFVKYLV